MKTLVVEDLVVQHEQQILLWRWLCLIRCNFRIPFSISYTVFRRRAPLIKMNNQHSKLDLAMPVRTHNGHHAAHHTTTTTTAT